MGLRNRLGRLLDKKSRKDRRSRLQRQRYQPRFEDLESRTLLTGFWTQIQATNPNSGPINGTQTLQLLSNGVIMDAQNTAPNPGANLGLGPNQTTWFQLNPSSSGAYVNGTWGQTATMNTARLYFPSVTMKDGRIFAIGGEFSPTVGFVNSPEIYNPVTNTWTPVAPMPSPQTQISNPPSLPPTSFQSQFGDDPVQLLPNGDILAGWFGDGRTYVYHPATNTWRETTGDKIHSTGGQFPPPVSNPIVPAINTDSSDEETFTLLPDGSILSYDIFASIVQNKFLAQRFDPVQDIWVDASTVDPNNPPSVLSTAAQGFELGPMVLLHDGRVMLFGTTGQTAFYDTHTGIWSKGPDEPIVNLNGIPRQVVTEDTPAAVMPNGKVLVIMSPGGVVPSPPSRVFEFDPNTNVFTDVTPPNFPTLPFNNFTNNDQEVFDMLVLPTGQVLITTLIGQGSGIFSGPDLIYTPDGGPQDAWRPVIQSISDNHNGTFSLTGLRLNGMSEGAYYGDDAMNSTNFPLLRMTDKLGNTVYARTFNWSSTGVQTGSQIVSTQFTLPVGTTLTDFNNYTVVASGIPSLPYQFHPTAPQTVSGTAFNDANANAVRDAGEGAMSHVFVYIDLNRDGKPGITEPSAVTDNYGRYSIPNVPPGSYVVREVIPVGLNQTLPGVAGIDLTGLGLVSYAYHIDVLDRTVTNVTFGNSNQPPAAGQDFGDAPDTYGTTLAHNGARAGILTNNATPAVPDFHLGLTEGGEPDGQPSVDASTDLDDDGVAFVGGGVTPGANGSVLVTVVNGSHSPGKLQGWIDFNQNGVFDANERIISNVTLAGGTIAAPAAYTLNFPVPAGAKFGNTFARFRYGYETDLGPTGSSIAGEVEDYQVTVLPAIPIANPDVFPRAGEAPIRQGSVGSLNPRTNVLDVLANDTPTTFGAPDIVAGSFPGTLPSGSTLTEVFDPTLGRNVLLYTPAANLVAPVSETFTYRVTDGHSVSSPGQVTVNVSPLQPVAVDDTFTDPASSNGPVQDQFHVTANDLFAFTDTQVLPGSLVNLTAGGSTTMAIDATNPSLVDFQAPVGFKGTEIWQYQIFSPSDPTAVSQPRFITVQVVDMTNPAHNNQLGGYDFTATSLGPTVPQLQAIVDGSNNQKYLAEMDVAITDLNGVPLSVINAGDQFLLKITSQDLRAGGSTSNRGVEAAYLDLLINRAFMQPVPNPDSTVPMQAITFDPQYTLGKSGQDGVTTTQNGQPVSIPTAGEINEAGASHQTGLEQTPAPPAPATAIRLVGVGPGPVQVFTVRMVAMASTPVGQATKVVADPRDETTPFSTVITVMPNNPDGLVPVGDPNFQFGPIQLANEQVFWRQSSNVTILGSGEGEFVNHSNPLDVNGDTHVSPSDALIVINSLNAYGSGLLSSPSLAPVAGLMVDVNMDSSLSPSDALAVINYINSQNTFLARTTTTSSATSGGEGESDVSVSDLSSTSVSSPTTTTTTPALTTSSGTQSPSSTTVDPAAADDVFAGLGSAREKLFKRFHR